MPIVGIMCPSGDRRTLSEVPLADDRQGAFEGERSATSGGAARADSPDFDSMQ